MNNEDEMMMKVFLDEQADADADEEGHLSIIAALLQLQVDEENNANPKRGGSRPGRWKSKPRQRMEEQAKVVDICEDNHRSSR